MFLLLKRSKLFGVRGWYIVKQVVLFASRRSTFSAAFRATSANNLFLLSTSLTSFWSKKYHTTFHIAIALAEVRIIRAKLQRITVRAVHN